MSLKRKDNQMLKANAQNSRKLRMLGYLFILPALCLVSFATIIPVLWNVVLSFSKWNGVSPIEFNGISGYIKVFTDAATMKSIRYSLIMSIVAISTAMILGISLALLIYKVTSFEGALFRFVFYSPSMLPLSVVGLLFTFVLATDEGLLNNMLSVIGMGNLQNAWLAKKGLVLIVIGIVQGWRSCGVVMMLVFTAIIGLPIDLFESSMLDGATYRKEIRYIILPLVKPTIQLALSMVVMSAFKTYDIVFSMTGGGPGDISRTAPLHIIDQAFQYNNYGYAASISVVYAAIIMLLIIILRRGIGGDTYEY